MSVEIVESSAAADVLRVQGVAKAFGAVRALSGADLSVGAGEIRALAGENGAGKSTLLKILMGEHHPDAGTMTLFGEPYAPGSVADARAAGVGIVFQETTLQPRLTVAENLLAADYGTIRRRGIISWKAVRENARRVLGDVGVTLDLDAPAESLELGEQRLVELAAAVARRPRLLLIDEITASLDAHEVARFFEVVHRLRDEGVGVVYVSHHLEEIFELCDTVTVLRDGAVVGLGVTSDFTHGSLTTTMVGREVTHRDIASTLSPSGERAVLELHRASDGKNFRGLDLEVRPGEIVGLAGLQGAGCESVLEVIFGQHALTEGRMTLDGTEYTPSGPRDAIGRRVALVPKERDLEGVIGPFSLARNVTLPIHDRVGSRYISTASGENAFAAPHLTSVGVRPNDPALPCESLSGGNRQKVVIAKWLATNPLVLLLNNPTRGVDVGAKDEIYQLLGELASQGMALLVVSEELPELIGLCRRVTVLRRGLVTATFGPDNPPTEDSILERMT